MKKFIRETITELAISCQPGVIVDLYHMRSGVWCPAFSDDAAREGCIALRLVKVREFELAAGPSGWMEAESMWAACLLAVDDALADPVADPKRMGWLAAERLRETIRVFFAMGEPVNIELRAAFLDDSADERLADIRIHGGKPGPVFAVAFLARFREIVAEEASVCVGR